MEYKILLLCAGGMSTSILMNKLKKYAADNGIDLSIQATGLSSVSYVKTAANFDVILMGPQVSYRIDEVKKNTGKPVAAIPSVDYALGNAEKIFAQAKELCKQVN